MEYGTLVSVVMPVYNRVHLIPRVLGSLVAQSYANLDIVIVDDASAEDVAGAVAAVGDPRVRLVRRAENGGVAAARNTGVAAARADWIAFHDSDDICAYDRIALSVRALAGRGPEWIGVYGQRIIYNAVGEADYARVGAYVLPRARAAQRGLSGDLAARMIDGNVINFPTLLVRRSALEAAGPSDPLLRKNVDWDLCIRLARQGRIAFLPEPLVFTPTPLDAAASAARVSRSVRQGARSYVRITGKIRRIAPAAPALAVHYASAANYLMRIGHAGFARRFLRASLAIRRMQPRLWGHYALSFVPALHARLRQPAKI